MRLFVAFFFSSFFLFKFYEHHLFPLNFAIDFQFILLDLAIDFPIHMMQWTDKLPIDGWSSRQTDKQKDGPMDGLMD